MFFSVLIDELFQPLIYALIETKILEVVVETKFLPDINQDPIKMMKECKGFSCFCSLVYLFFLGRIMFVCALCSRSRMVCN